MNTDPSGVAQIIEVAKATVSHQVVTVNGVPTAYLYDAGLRDVAIDQRATNQSPLVYPPMRQPVFDAESFALALDQLSQPSPNTVFVRASRHEKSITAILNHQSIDQGVPNERLKEPSGNRPGWCDRSVVLRLEDSDELNACSACFDWIGQIAFAELLEERSDEAENGAELFEAAKNLSIVRDASFKGSIRLDSGSVRLQVNDDVRSEIELPPRVNLRIPLFKGGPRYNIECLLRFRLRDGVVKFLLKPLLLEKSIDDNFSEIVHKIEGLIPYRIVREP